ncbi:hypothetical protein FTX61_13030 [Nitriliruptoraceae bacterium ZYF776]|nr:hypothetical protein [Profundirhabdus halotolerans]
MRRHGVASLGRVERGVFQPGAARARSDGSDRPTGRRRGTLRPLVHLPRRSPRVSGAPPPPPGPGGAFPPSPDAPRPDGGHHGGPHPGGGAPVAGGPHPGAPWAGGQQPGGSQPGGPQPGGPQPGGPQPGGPQPGGPYGGGPYPGGPVPAGGPPPSRRRRWPLVVALLVGLAGAGVAVQQRQVAASWRDRATTAGEDLDDAQGRNEALQSQLDEVANALSTSEGDVTDLEARIRELADEKAQAEDTATTVQIERDVFLDLSSAIAGSVTSLDGCVDDLFDLLNESIDAFNRQGSGENVDVGPLNRERESTTDGCNEARADAAAAAAAADALLQ